MRVGKQRTDYLYSLIPNAVCARSVQEKAEVRMVRMGRLGLLRSAKKTPKNKEGKMSRGC